MGRARQHIANSVNGVVDGFTATFGSGRGNVGARDLANGEDTSAARAHAQQLAAAAARGDAADALEVLRDCGRERFSDELFAPLIEGIVADARDHALNPEWLLTAQYFCEATQLRAAEARTIIVGVNDILHLWPRGATRVTATSMDLVVTWACGETHTWAQGAGQYNEGPPYPIRRARRGAWARAQAEERCRGCAEHAQDYPECAEQSEGDLWEVIDRQEYERALDMWLRADLRRGISHLRDSEDVRTWLVDNGVQGALINVVTAKLMSAAGEDALHRALGETHYQRYRQSARAHGLAGVHQLLDNADALEEKILYLLPTCVGDRADLRALDRFSIESYSSCVATGLDTLTAMKALTT